MNFYAEHNSGVVSKISKIIDKENGKVQYLIEEGELVNEITVDIEGNLYLQGNEVTITTMDSNRSIKDRRQVNILDGVNVSRSKYVKREI